MGHGSGSNAPVHLSMTDLIGKTLGQYQILREIGRGGMAVVYEAEQPLLGRTVAIKVLPPEFTFDKTFVQRFLHEGRAAARLKHPHVVSIFDVGEQPGVYYIVMEKLEGESLHSLIRRTGRLPLPRASFILAQIADALDYAHAHGLIHRDIKPANIIVGPDDHATLTDFGIVKAAEGTALTQTGTLMGTPEYMSPEQARGESAGASSDLYALGITLYEMLAGKTPFRADSPVVVLYKQAFESPTPVRASVPDLPPAADAVLAKALAKEPAQRFRTAGELARALAHAGATAPAVAVKKPGQVSGKWWAAPGGRIGYILVAGVLAVTVIAGGSLLLNRLFTRSDAVVATSRSATPRSASAQSACLAFETMTPFVSDRSGKAEIYCLAQNTTVQMTHSPGPSASWGPAPAENGDILFTSDRSGKREIWSLTEAGVVQWTHTPGDGESWEPAPAENGDVLFTSDRSGKREIWGLTRAGVVQWTHTPGAGESWAPAPAASGDVLFSSDRNGKREVWGLTDAGVVQWTHTPGDGESWGAAASPDGAIFFTSDRSGKREVWGVTQVGVFQWTHTPGAGESWGPAPAASGDIMFTSDRNGKPEVFRLTQDGVAAVTFTDGEGGSFTASAVGDYENE